MTFLKKLQGGGGVNALCDVNVNNGATVTSEPEHFCAYHPPNPGTVTASMASVSHLDLRRPGVGQSQPREVHTSTPGRRFISSTMH